MIINKLSNKLGEQVELGHHCTISLHNLHCTILLGMFTSPETIFKRESSLNPFEHSVAHKDSIILKRETAASTYNAKG